jgi:hypothetical protein
MEIVKGKTYFIAGCSRSFQKANRIVANFVEKREYFLEIDGENVISYGLVVSKNGITWYPENTLTDKLS